MVPVALLGLRNEENLYIAEDGSTDAHYIPAFARRCPFELAETGERVIRIDASFAGFSCDAGEALFENGEATPILTQAIEFLEEYQKQYIRTGPCVNAFATMIFLCHCLPISIGQMVKNACLQAYCLSMKKGC